jgi:hypothetical protein
MNTVKVTSSVLATTGNFDPEFHEAFINEAMIVNANTILTIDVINDNKFILFMENGEEVGCWFYGAGPDYSTMLSDVEYVREIIEQLKEKGAKEVGPNSKLIAKLELERDELQKKLDRLTYFLYSNYFRNIPEDQQDLLNLQDSVMVQYVSILEMRIKSLKEG